MDELLRCSVCGDAIGTYEPLVVIERGAARPTSLAREPDAATRADAVVHRGCARTGGIGFADASAATAA